MLGMGDQVLAQLAAAAQHHDQLAGQHRRGGQPGRAGPAPRSASRSRPLSARSGSAAWATRSTSSSGSSPASSQRSRMRLRGPRVDEPAAGQAAPRRRDPNHTPMLRTSLRPAPDSRSCRSLRLVRSATPVADSVPAQLHPVRPGSQKAGTEGFASTEGRTSHDRSSRRTAGLCARRRARHAARHRPARQRHRQDPEGHHASPVKVVWSTDLYDTILDKTMTRRRQATRTVRDQPNVCNKGNLAQIAHGINRVLHAPVDLVAPSESAYHAARRDGDRQALRPTSASAHRRGDSARSGHLGLDDADRNDRSPELVRRASTADAHARPMLARQPE